ncbi:hypothetical protein CANCADRAFT_42700 [Tortispora caseinolytica NRRL Y-17796]|uniref:Uncharacterized protein n=1 Tax=Tortispora caseinolytica NRRL Y-17796 TaxID=767744 RepID=A0A1E4TK08_9ASCO|nr:hypothetical protein CANCADRAFT_42700 [Tortispora caseinolytica NRRL Y-17796]
MPSSCKDLRTSFAICLQRSQCVLIDRHTPKECMENDELRATLPTECELRLKAFIKCKRGLVDFRKRMRGNGPLSTGKYDEQYEKLCEGDFDPYEELKKTNPII